MGVFEEERNKWHLINRLENECYVYSSGDINVADEVEKINWELENSYLNLDLEKVEALSEEKDNLESSMHCIMQQLDVGLHLITIKSLDTHIST